MENKAMVHNINFDGNNLSQKILKLQKQFEQKKAQMKEDHQQQLENQNTNLTKYLSIKHSQEADQLKKTQGGEQEKAQMKEDQQKWLENKNTYLTKYL